MQNKALTGIPCIMYLSEATNGAATLGTNIGRDYANTRPVALMTRVTNYLTICTRRARRPAIGTAAARCWHGSGARYLCS